MLLSGTSRRTWAGRAAEGGRSQGRSSNPGGTMTRFALFIGLCLSLPATVARADEDKAVAEAARSLQGTWEVREAEIGGPNRVEKLPVGGRRTFDKDGTYKVELMGTEIRE